MNKVYKMDFIVPWAKNLWQPLKLVGSDGAEYSLAFDCGKCEMAVIGDIKK